MTHQFIDHRNQIIARVVGVCVVDREMFFVFFDQKIHHLVKYLFLCFMLNRLLNQFVEGKEKLLMKCILRETFSEVN